MGQDRSSVSCDDEAKVLVRSLAEAVAGAAVAAKQGKPVDYRSDWERREAELADARELADEVVDSVVIHTEKIETLHRRVTVLEADKKALQAALLEAFVQIGAALSED